MASLHEVQTQWSLLDLVEANLFLSYEDEVKLIHEKELEKLSSQRGK